MPADELSYQARALRLLHNGIGIGELACLGYLWICAIARRRDVLLRVSTFVLIGEGVALLAARGCPLGIFQRRAGDEVPMFERWFGPRLAPLAVPAFTAMTVVGMALLVLRGVEPTGAQALTVGVSP